MPYSAADSGRSAPPGTATFQANLALRRWRVVVLGAGLLALFLKLWIAASTFGTTDVFLWQEFAQAVRERGPVGIYGQQFQLVYNHAPLSGWMLVAINWLTDHGMGGFPFLIRLPASLADVVTVMVVFELGRQRRSLREAALAASLVALSPMLLIVSGFHGNTDPVLVMFALLAGYLLAVRRVPILAGVAFGLALSIKLVPIVVLPTLVVLLAREGWRRAGGFVLGVGGAMLPLWLPVVLTKWTAFRADVLGYAGVPLRQWGLVQLLKWMGLTPAGEELIAGPGRFAILLICAGLPALLAWRRPTAAGAALGLAFVLFLFLTPAFGMQYLSWGVAGAYLVSTWAATLFNAIGSVFMIVVYDHWNNAYPWDWNVAPGMPFRPVEMVLQVPVWLSLGVVAVNGLRLLRGTDLPTSTRPHVGRAHALRPNAQQGTGIRR